VGERSLVFRNGGVFDGRRHRERTGIVVSGGRVRQVASDGDLVVPPGAEEVDLAGGLVLPGFQDAHAHPVQGGLERRRCDLAGLHGRDAHREAVRRYVVGNPDAPWVLGGGWSMAAFGVEGPTASELDALVADRPAFLVNADHHGAWVNTLALQLAGIDRNTPDPADGRIQRDAAGNPTGMLHEGAMAPVQRLLPDATERELDAALLEAQAYLHSRGITAWQDAILGAYAGHDDPAPVYVRAAEAGRLTARVRGALWWRRDQGLEQVEDLVLRRSALRRARLDAGAVKVMQDGIAENYTAAMTTPYLDGCGCPTSNAGLSFVDPLVLREAVVRLDAEGFQVHFHAIGDRAVREALDAIGAARSANGANDLRHHLAHIQVIHPDDRPRFAALDASATMQPLWAALDEAMVDLTLPFLDPETVAWQYPFGDLARLGATLAAGSDWPVSSPDPLAGIHVAVNRTVHGGDGRASTEPFLPEQALTLEQAFAAYTAGSARVNHLDETGRLAPGKLADLAVLDRDPFLRDPGEVGAARVLATYVEGTCVFG
jgi:predicted amidohydrolase YtcJ